jgi:hypothetical protein
MRSNWWLTIAVLAAISWGCDDGDTGAGDAAPDRGLILGDFGTGELDRGVIEDPDMALPACSDGRDNDQDGLIDFPDDRGCVDAEDADEFGPSACADGEDNDADGHVDYPADPGCGGVEDDDEFNEPLLPECADAIDNDRDGLLDEQDPGCRSVADNDESDDPDELPACFDKIDNDGDGIIDFPLEPGCATAGDTDEDERSIPVCGNGQDDDEDGHIDYPIDPGCAGVGDSTEVDKGMQPECADGQDNDRDGRIDYPDDSECYAASDASERGPCGTTYTPPRLQNGETYVVDTARGLFESAGTCGGMGSPEQVVLYRVERDIEALVISTVGDATSVPTTLYVRRGVCLDPDPRTEVGCVREDEHPEVPGQTLRIENVAAGDYYVVVDGVAGDAGPVALTITEVPLAECLNRTDDDEDGRVDYPEDPGCAAPSDRTEVDEVELFACSNDEDDDEDGLVDYPLDPGCVSAAHNDENDVCGESVAWQEYFPEFEFLLSSTREADGASNQHAGSCGGRGAPERVFLFNNPSRARLIISTAHPETEQGTVVYVRRNCIQAATELACDEGEQAGTNLGRVNFVAEAGAFWIVVDNRFGQGGDFKLTVTREE